MSLAEAADRTYTVVTCHFGDLFWVTHTLQQVDRWSDGRVASVVVVDQNRSDRAALESLPRVAQVLEFEANAECVAVLGHDHPVALNRALGEFAFTTSHVIVLDSDCFPTNPSWLDRLDDVTLAAGPEYLGMTHPCFMAFPVRAIPSLDFFEGVTRFGIDTGRLVGLQMLRAGEELTVLRPGQPAPFGGTRGQHYLDGTIYHHGSASFVYSLDQRVRRQVKGTIEERYRRRIAAGSFTITPAILVLLGLRRMKMRLRRRAGVVYRAMRRLLTR